MGGYSVKSVLCSAIDCTITDQRSKRHNSIPGIQEHSKGIGVERDQSLDGEPSKRALGSSTQDHVQADRRTLADIPLLIIRSLAQVLMQFVLSILSLAPVRQIGSGSRASLPDTKRGLRGYTPYACTDRSSFFLLRSGCEAEQSPRPRALPWHSLQGSCMCATLAQACQMQLGDLDRVHTPPQQGMRALRSYEVAAKRNSYFLNARAIQIMLLHSPASFVPPLRDPPPRGRVGLRHVLDGAFQV
jgi:hypothetical protein